jgi:hypothetical protein
MELSPHFPGSLVGSLVRMCCKEMTRQPPELRVETSYIYIALAPELSYSIHMLNGRKSR